MELVFIFIFFLSFSEYIAEKSHFQIVGDFLCQVISFDVNVNSFLDTPHAPSTHTQNGHAIVL